MAKTFLETAKDKTLIFDGAMGTMLMAAGLPSVEIPILLNVEKPTLVMDIHKHYFEAGADVVITNTFGGNPIKLATDGLSGQIEILNQKAVRIAQNACPEGKFVAGDMGPSGKMLKPLGDVAVGEMTEAYSLQARELVTSGVDLLIIETMFSLEEAVAAVHGAREAGDILLIASMTFNRTNNGYFTMMGESVVACAAALTKAGADIIGANCTLGSLEMIDLTKELRASTDMPILIQPNAGQPVTRKGVTYYEQSPSDFASDARKIKKAGADMIGGCCGTRPEFIQAVAAVMSGNRFAD
jgi:5-methyltetrahydrofolate--homocysteine methyltransferase